MKFHLVFTLATTSLLDFSSCIPIPPYPGPQLHTFQPEKSENAKFLDRWNQNFGGRYQNPTSNGPSFTSTITGAADQLINSFSSPPELTKGKQQPGAHANPKNSILPVVVDGPSDSPKYTIPVVKPEVPSIVVTPPKDAPRVGWEVATASGGSAAAAASGMEMVVYKPKTSIIPPKTIVMPPNTMTVEGLASEIVRQAEVPCIGCATGKKKSGWGKFADWIKGAWGGLWGIFKKKKD